MGNGLFAIVDIPVRARNVLGNTFESLMEFHLFAAFKSAAYAAEQDQNQCRDLRALSSFKATDSNSAHFSTPAITQTRRRP